MAKRKRTNNDLQNITDKTITFLKINLNDVKKKYLNLNIEYFYKILVFHQSHLYTQYHHHTGNTQVYSCLVHCLHNTQGSFYKMVHNNSLKLGYCNRYIAKNQNFVEVLNIQV
jgi:hypothetical protein